MLPPHYNVCNVHSYNISKEKRPKHKINTRLSWNGSNTFYTVHIYWTNYLQQSYRLPEIHIWKEAHLKCTTFLSFSLLLPLS